MTAWTLKPAAPGYWLEIWMGAARERGTDLREYIGCVNVTQGMLDDPKNTWTGHCMYLGPVPVIQKVAK